MAAGFLQNKRSQEVTSKMETAMPFYNLVSKVTHHYLYFVKSKSLSQTRVGRRELNCESSRKESQRICGNIFKTNILNNDESNGA